MRSMTGLGAASRSAAKGKGKSGAQALALSAEVRSVNHKFLQLKLRLPSELALLEPEVEVLVRKRLERGSVTLNVSSHGAAQLSALALDVDVARRYHVQLLELARELGLEPKVELEDLAKLPGVFSSEPDSKAMQQGRKLLLEVVEAALDNLEEMREREGQALARDLAKHGAQIARIAAQIRTRMPLVVKAHQDNLRKRVAELLGEKASLAPADVAREIALLADRLDVTEEITRLESHLAQLQVLCAKNGSVGRQLDFLVQEFLREANTIGSKCNDAQVAHAVVELKTSIERLREQVQNVE
jgi:uncharacterized protein (TIGR00255 family)